MVRALYEQHLAKSATKPLSCISDKMRAEVGMVVDNSIVVVESIYRRRELGEPPLQAALEGTAEVALAIVAATLTTIVVFLPLITMSNDARFSFFMGRLGLPVCYALISSLVVALVIVAHFAPRPPGACDWRCHLLPPLFLPRVQHLSQHSPCWRA